MHEYFLQKTEIFLKYTVCKLPLYDVLKYIKIIAIKVYKVVSNL